MRKLLSRAAAAATAAVITFCGCFANFTVFAEDEAADAKNVKVIFDFIEDKENIELDYRSVGNMSSFEDFEPMDCKAGDLVIVPYGKFKLEGKKFSGWTIDGIYGYTGGEGFLIPDDYDEDEIVVKAAWYDPKADTVHGKYILEYNGAEVERPEWLDDVSVYPGMVFEPNYGSITGDKFFSYGLTYEGNKLSVGKKIVAPDHDFELYPNWFKKITVTITAGDVDRLIGKDIFVTELNEGSSSELSAADKFSRKGFYIAGWKSSIDGEVYAPLQTYTVPSEDVTFTAVWMPTKYNVVFITGNGGQNFRIPGETDTKIICPDPEHTVSGKYFAGWKDENGNIYQPGDEYLIEGVIPGLGISLKGVWEVGEAPVQKLPEPTLLGDANNDGVLTIADSTAILQHMANQDKYGLTPQGMSNADCYDPGSGVSGLDALAIQKVDAKIIDALPEMPA